MPDPDFYDHELSAHHRHLRAAYGISAGDAVLDIGCGAGQTTREAARAATPGVVVGLDISEPMLVRAVEATATEGLSNVRYRLGDGQTVALPESAFDVAISRFGTMFFTDPLAAFTNIATALRPGARFVSLVWQRREDNGWARALDEALGDAWRPPAPGADPFSLGDRAATTRLLVDAGFEDPRFSDLEEPVFYGAEVEVALATVRGFLDTAAALDRLDADLAGEALDRLRAVLGAHLRPGHGVVFEARSWLITARRRPAKAHPFG